MGPALQAFQNFWKRPFNPEGSVPQWFLFFGLLIVIAFAWSRILRFVQE